MKWLLSLLLVSSLGAVQAQTYVGVGGTWLASSTYGSVLLPSVQIGGPTAPEFGGLELRVALATLLLFQA